MGEVEEALLELWSTQEKAPPDTLGDLLSPRRARGIKIGSPSFRSLHYPMQFANN